MLISIVIPCYRSEKTISTVYKQLDAVTKSSNYEFEFIFVNDASPDNLQFTLEKLANEDTRLKVIHLSRNFGQHSALMAGFEFVSGEIVVCMDDDGQTPPKEIDKLIEGINSQVDVVFARYPDKKHTLYRNLFSRANDLLSIYLLSKPKEIYITSFFAVKRFVIEEVKKYSGPYPYIGGLILRITRKLSSIEIMHEDRISGESSYTFRKLLKLWLNGFTSFSTKPLQVSSYIGFLLAVFGFIFGIKTIISKFLNPDVPLGYSSLISSILFVGGMILVMLGLIGEYVGRIFLSINHSPQYVIRSVINVKD